MLTRSSSDHDGDVALDLVMAARITAVLLYFYSCRCPRGHRQKKGCRSQTRRWRGRSVSWPLGVVRHHYPALDCGFRSPVQLNSRPTLRQRQGRRLWRLESAALRFFLFTTVNPLGRHSTVPQEFKPHRSFRVHVLVYNFDRFRCIF